MLISKHFSFSSMMKGSESHKNIDLSGNPVLKLYYTSRVCLMSEGLI